MKAMPIRLLLVLLLVLVAHGGEIQVILNPKSTNVFDALIILFPPKVSVIKGQSTLKYCILNRSEKDIFVVIKSKNIEGWDHLKRGGEEMGGGGRYIGLSSRHESLRLLYAPRRSPDGEISEGEDELIAMTSAEVNVDCGVGKDLSDWAGASGTLDLLIRFYVSDSKSFKLVNLVVPIEIKAAEQAGADQPATKPADKQPVKDQPSPPTSADHPR